MTHDELLAQVAKLIYNGKWVDGTISPAMVQEVAELLFAAVKEGFNTGATSAHQDPEILKALELNVYQFSGFRNYQQLKELSALLKQHNRIATFSEFYKAAKRVDKVWNDTYLKTEYDHAQATSTMIGKWKAIQSDKNVLPWLQYETVGDGKVREAHAVLQGITRRVDDTFWKTYYPPNGWNCRCTVRQLSSAEATDLTQVELPTLAPMFRANAGVDGVVFPETHPYFQDAEKDRVKIKNQSTLAMPRVDQFRRTKDYGNGYVDEHILVDTKADDYKQVSTVANELARRGDKVEILPVVTDQWARDIVMPHAYGNRSSDLKLNGQYADVKSYKGYAPDKDTLSKMFSRANGQADILIVYMNHKYNEVFLESYYKNRLKNKGNKTIKRVMVRTVSGDYLNITL